MTFEAHLMAFLDFNVLETWRQYKLISNLGILNYFNYFLFCFFFNIKWFLNYCEICRRGPNYIQEW